MGVLGWMAAAAAAFELDGEVRWADDVEILTGDGAALAVDDGFVFPVRSGADPATVGYVVVGAGEASFRFARPTEALGFADTLAARMGVPEAEARRALDTGAWREPFDVAVVLGVHPAVTAPVAQLPRVVDGRDDVVYLDTDPEEVVVQTWGIGEARRRASRALAARVQRLAATGLDPAAMLAQAALEPDAPRWLAEVHTERTWRPFVEPASVSLQDGWLSFAHDPTGLVDDLYRDVVFVHGLLDRPDHGPAPRLRVLTGAPHRGPVAGARIEEAAVNAVVRPGTSAHQVDFEALLVLASDTDTRVVQLAIPIAEALQLAGLRATHTFRRVAVETADGRPLEPAGEAFGPWRPPGSWNVAAWRLPATLPAGGRTAVRVRWTDHWPAAHVLDVHEWIVHELVQAGVCTSEVDCACFIDPLVGSPTAPNGNLVPAKVPQLGDEQPAAQFRGRFPAATDLGAVAVGLPVVPVVPGRPDRFPAEIRVGTVLGRGWRAAIDGRVEERRQGDGRWWIARTTGAGRVSFGQLAEDRVSGVGPFPAVRVLHHGAMDVDPAFVRGVVRFFDAALPPYPGDTVTVVQGPAAPRVDPAVVEAFPCVMNRMALGALTPDRRSLEVPFGTVPMERDAPWTGRTDDQILISGIREVGNQVGGVERSVALTYPHLVERHVAEGIAARWWAGVGAGRRDEWIAPAAAAFYRDAFVREAFPDALARWDGIRADDLERAVGRRAFVPLATAREPHTGEAGAWVLRGLAARIGERAMLRGLDAFLRGTDHDTAALAAALSEAAGTDVGPWFDTWIHVGARPEVIATWWVSERGVEVEVEADLPFGRLEVPVVVTTAAGRSLAWVSVRDGSGAAAVPVVGKVRRVEVDPDGLLPLKRRTSVRRTEDADPVRRDRLLRTQIRSDENAS